MSSHNPFIQQLSRLDRASPQFSDQLTTLFDERNNEDHVPNLSDQDALWAVEYLDDVRTPLPLPLRFLKPAQVLDTLAPTSSAFKGCLRALELICKTWKILPKSYTLPGIPLITSSHPVVPGAIADIYEGTLNGSKVHVKQTRTYSTYSDEDMWRVQMVRYPFFPFPLSALKRAPKSYQEAIMWKHARHPNIVPFLGITNTPFQLVSNWMPGGNLVGYIKENPGADRLDLVGFPLMCDANVSHPASYSESLRLCITSTPATSLTGTLKGHVKSEKYYRNPLTNILAKHSCRRCRARVSYGFWPCHRNSEPGTHHTRSRVLFHTMGRTGDPTGGNWHKQGNRHLFVRDGRD